MLIPYLKDALITVGITAVPLIVGVNWRGWKDWHVRIAGGVSVVSVLLVATMVGMPYMLGVWLFSTVWLLMAGISRQHAIRTLVKRVLKSHSDIRLAEVSGEIVGNTLERELNELLPLIEPLGKAPLNAQITPDWIHEQLASEQRRLAP